MGSEQREARCGHNSRDCATMPCGETSLPQREGINKELIWLGYKSVRMLELSVDFLKQWWL